MFNLTVYLKYCSWEWIFIVLVKTYVVYIYKSKESKIMLEKVILFKTSKCKLEAQMDYIQSMILKNQSVKAMSPDV